MFVPEPRRILAVMACDLADDGATLGPETIARCKAAYDIYRRHGEKEKPLIVLGAGFASKAAQPRQEKSMASMMADYFLSHGVPEQDMRAPPSMSRTQNAWGSGRELVVAIGMAFAAGAIILGTEGGDWYGIRARITVVTSKYHARRCALLVKGSLRGLTTFLEKNAVRAGRVNYFAPRLELEVVGVVRNRISPEAQLEEVKKWAATLLLLCLGNFGRRKLGLIWS